MRETLVEIGYVVLHQDGTPVKTYGGQRAMAKVYPTLRGARGVAGGKYLVCIAYAGGAVTREDG